MGQQHWIILGGDARMRAVAEAIAEQGYHITDLPEADASALPLIHTADFVLLPVPALQGELVRGTSIPYAALLDQLSSSSRLYGGKLPITHDPRITDYQLLESFQQANAIPTAEGAIQIMMEQLPITLFRSRILIIGFGRIGKVLATRARDLGASVTVSARKADDFEKIQSLGLSWDETHQFTRGLDYDCIVNTVPAPVLSREILQKLKPECFLLDLASLPGGIDFSACQELGLRYEHALSLPGLVAPKTAGLIIQDVVLEHLNQHQKGC